MRRSDEITISSRDGCYSAVACFFLFFLSTTFAFAHQRSRKCAANQHSLPVYSFTRSSFSLPCSPLRTCERRFFHWQRPPTANWTSSRRMSAFGRILIFCRILIQNEKFFFWPASSVDSMLELRVLRSCQSWRFKVFIWSIYLV